MTEELDIHRAAFREEAHELLSELETSLLEWEERPTDPELLQTVFRAMHTIKGSGSMFGFDDIASFAHEVETILDLAREGAITVTSQLVDLTLAARDQIQVMVDAAEGGETADEKITKELIASFARWNPAGSGDATPAHGEARSKTEGPPAESAAKQGEPAKEATYRIRFRPNPEVFARGVDPLLLLDEIRELGATKVIAHLDAVPPLHSYQTESCYTYWDLLVTTSQGINAIKDVFIFVEDDSELKIDLIDEADRFEEDIDHQRLGEILTARGDISQAELKKALDSQPQLGEMLVEAGLVAGDRVQSALEEQRHVKEMRERRQKSAAVLSIRVPSDKLDHLVDLVGETVTVQARLSQLALNSKNPELVSVAEEVERLTGELRDNTMVIRMVPIGSLFNKFRRLVRDLSHDLGREVEMITEGSETELDKTVIERLNDPLVHLIRNCIDHGIEPGPVRNAAGKPQRGTLNISAEHSGAYVLIRIKDDGAGIDAEAIKAKAVEKGLIAPEAELSEAEIYQLIFAPGFSTSKNVTEVSGRGVGMDVVKRNIEALRGTVEIASRKGEGTEITLRLPLTLAIIDGLLVTVGKEFFVIPLSVIEECVELRPEDVKKSHGRKTVTVRNELVPYIRLRDRFAINGKRPEIEQVVIGSVNSQRVGFVVDRVIGDHQTVIKALGRVFKRVSDVSGATILGDGTLALILDVNKLLQAAVAEKRSTERGAGRHGTAKNSRRRRTELKSPPREIGAL